MARYCFYCGKELGAGERCTCRTASQNTYQQEFHEPPPQPKAEEPKPKKEPFFERFRKKTNPNPRQRSSFSQFFRDTLSFLHKLFTRPTEIITGAAKASRRRLIIASVVEALVFGLLIMTFVRYSNLARLAMLPEMDVTADDFMQSTFGSLLRGFVAAIFLSVMRIVISMLVFRFVGRQRIGFEDLWRAFLPGTYYEILIMLLAVFFVAGSGLQALVMLLCAFGIRMVIDTLSLKNYVSLSQDRLLLQTTVIHFLLFLLLSFLLNLSVPSLANFGVVPQNNTVPVEPNLVIEQGSFTL